MIESGFTWIDYSIFATYLLVIIGAGMWVSRTKKGTEKTAQDYFLAARALPWWVIGSSLLAANISAEHFVAMSGSGYALGIAVASYEWIAAFTLIIVGKFFLPVFINKNIFTMPQFCEQRFDKRVSTSLAVFWLLVYVFVNLTSVIYLGALTMQQIFGIPLMAGIIGLALVALLYSLWGGLEAVAWTDVIQVIVLVGGGFVTTYLALDHLSGGNGFFAGMDILLERAPEKFHMILERGKSIIPDTVDPKTCLPVTTKDAFVDLPGIAVLLGAMWITNFGYWGFNQYIIQRGLAAKDLNHAKHGVIFAGYLKLLVPLLVIIPGIVAFTMKADICRADEAYPWLIKNFVPTGVKGLAMAAIAAAIISSLGSMVNSTSTIFTMDIYRVYINKNATEKQLLKTGRIVGLLALIIAVIIAPQLSSLNQVFQYIQEFTAFVYPGVLVIFFTGLFWKQATTRAALWVAILTLPVGIFFKIVTPEIPFIFRMGYVFTILAFTMIAVSLIDQKDKVAAIQIDPVLQKLGIRMGTLLIILSLVGAVVSSFYVKEYSNWGLESIYVILTFMFIVGIILLTNEKMTKSDPKALDIDPGLFNTSWIFNLGAIGITGILFVLYYFFW